jgi:hypothetical protein
MFCVRGKTIVQGQFFAVLYYATAKDQHVSWRPAVGKIWLATVIDQLGSVAAHGSVDDPALVESR